MKQISTLVPMTQFILDAKYVGQETLNYAKFITTPLRLGFFVPCTLDDVPLSEPPAYAKTFAENNDANAKAYLKEYADAKSRCLFEGFELEYVNKDESGTCIRKGDLKIIFYSNRIEFDSDIQSDWQILRDLDQLKYADIKLTPTAIQQIYGR